jgi:dienelactone hydrolase
MTDHPGTDQPGRPDTRPDTRTGAGESWPELVPFARALVDAPSHRGLVAAPDGDTIAFTERRAGRDQLVTGRDKGAGYDLTTWPGIPGRPACWLGADRLLLSSDETGGHELATLRVLDVADGGVRDLPGAGTTAVRVTDADPRTGRFLAVADRSHGHDCADTGAASVWVGDAEVGLVAPLACLPEPATTGCWSPDATLVAVGGRTAEGEAVRVVEVATGQVRHAVPGAAPAFWLGGGRLVTRSETPARMAAGILDLASGAHRLLDGPADEIPLCAAGGDRLLLARLADAEVALVLHDLRADRSVRVPTGPGVFTDPRRWLEGIPGAAVRASDGSAVTSFSSPAHPFRVVTVDLTSGAVAGIDAPAAEARAAAATAAPAAPEAPEAPEAPATEVPATTVPIRLRYPSRDGYLVPALLYPPPGPVRGAVVMLHGGPDWLWFHDYDPAAQVWARAGFAVLKPNVRGSAGYGTAHRDAVVRDWGGPDLLDVLGAADHLIAAHGVPADRLCLYGASYGGYLAYLAALSPATPYTATCAWAAPSDLRLLFREAPGQYRAMLRQVLGDPADDPSWWADRSPVTHAANLRGRLLIVQGARDPRTPAGQGRAMRAALLAAGRVEGTDFSYVELDQGHAAGTGEDRFRSLTLASTFLLDAIPQGTIPPGAIPPDAGPQGGGPQGAGPQGAGPQREG